jgi:hypothetical protein
VSRSAISIGRKLAVPAAVTPPPHGRRPPDLLLAGAGLLALQLATLALADGWGLFTTPAWLDEYHSLFVAGRGSVLTSIYALKQGADFNPPLLPLAQRGVGLLSGGLDLSGQAMLPLRLLSFVCVWGTLIGTYALLRPNFPRVVAFIAAAALWTHPLIVQHSFEARFYGPWALCTVLFALAASRAGDSPPSLHRLAIALSAAALCLVHYFGVISWGLIVVALVVHDSRASPFAWRTTARRLAPAIAGPLALAICIPLYLGQRHALTVATWIQPATATKAVLFMLLVVWPLGLLGGSLRLASVGMRSTGESTPVSASVPTRSRGAWALLALVLLPVVLIAFSFLVQPALIDRYATVGVLSGAPVIAWSLRRYRTGGHVLALAVAAALSVMAIRHRASLNRQATETNARIARNITTHVGRNELVVFATRRTMYPVVSLLPHFRASMLAFPDFGDSMRQGARDFDIVERDAARVHARLYGFPTLRRMEDLRRLGRFLLVTREDTSAFAQLWFPGHRAEHIAPYLFRLRLADVGAIEGGGATPP